MVRITSILARVPVIKFRKGGGATAPAATQAAPATASVSQQAINGQQQIASSDSAPAGFMVPRAIMIQYGKKGDVIVFKMMLQKLENKLEAGNKY